MRTRPGARLRVGVATALLLSPLLAAAHPVDDTPVHGSPGIGDPYWALDGNGGYDVISYRVQNRYAFRTRRLSGRTTIRLTATSRLSSFSLDFLLPVTSVEVNGEVARHRSDGGHELRVTPTQPLASGARHRVVVRYAGVPGRHTYAGGHSWLSSRHEVITMNQPHMAPWWFPSNDHPSDKATMDIAITVPRGKQAIANGRLVSRVDRARTTTWRWRADEPMAPYLAFFAAGEFRIERGRDGDLPWLIAVSSRLGPSTQRASLTLMRKTPRIVRTLEKDLGPYPFSTTGGVTTSLDPGFALENQTRPTYPAVGPDLDDLVVHELAHQWLGNHLSVARWSDIWINEGMATFMEWRWAERRHGTSADQRLRLLHGSYAPSLPFWRVQIGDPGAARLFHDAVYVRGAMTMQALRNRVGEEAFWTIVRTWLADHGGGNASSAQFRALAEQVSGQDLEAFFRAWLDTPARPASTAANGLG